MCTHVKGCHYYQEPGGSADVFQGDLGQYRRMAAVGDSSEKQWLTEQQLKAGGIIHNLQW